MKSFYEENGEYFIKKKSELNIGNRRRSDSEEISNKKRESKKQERSLSKRSENPINQIERKLVRYANNCYPCYFQQLFCEAKRLIKELNFGKNELFMNNNSI